MITHHVKLHWETIKLKLAARMAYRGDFLLSVIAFFVVQLTAPLFTSVVYASGGSFPGWSLYQVFILQGIFSIVLGVGFTMFAGLLWITEHRMKTGALDLILLKPANALWLMIMESFDEEDAARIVSGVLLVAIGLSKTDAQGSVALAIGIAGLGLLFYFALGVVFSALTIRFIRTRLYEIVVAINVFASYPTNIYGVRLGTIFTSIVPLALIAYLPASALLGLPLDGLKIASVSIMIIVVVSVWFWFKTLRKYSSAGG